MNKELILQMQSQFDALTQSHPEATDVEFWFARDLQQPLGYARWENFLTTIQRAIESCKTTGYEAGHHFRGVTKLITHGKGGQREIEDQTDTNLVIFKDGKLLKIPADELRKQDELKNNTQT